VREKGFTLLEVLAVVFVLGLLTVTAFTAVHSLNRGQLKTSAQLLANHIREARLTAMTNGVTCTLTFYELGGRYRLDLPDGTRYIKLPEGVRFAANNFPQVDRRPTLRFRYTGAPNRGGHVTLKDESGAGISIIVTPVTGRVRLEHILP